MAPHSHYAVVPVPPGRLASTSCSAHKTSFSFVFREDRAGTLVGALRELAEA